ncbi:Valine-tRNA ligase [Spironucleus salmonicida]|uniref:valine--tRNA ligase n=1 Tax=Spironucleus salmonicida TaxID=348837 RepID=V6LLW3_9EUKA|nr:Valine-tRNA ligase [Spironucleus salmonicida]|eukprot:EST45672.1 Valine-tRNA ligase [Spironucleus salmonicida]
MSTNGKALKKQQKLDLEEKELVIKQVGKSQTTTLQSFNYDNETVSGSKKDISGQWPPAYNPMPIEQSWYEYWNQKGYFKPIKSDHKFVILIPPPNVTGSLHIGHALTNAVQDALVRYYRASGYETLWLPGMDHAGISCQVVVEKKLAKENITKYDLGREKFVEKIWEWKNEYGNKIYKQLKKLGSSLDWERSVFTLDSERIKAHDEAFKRFFDDGLIYRDNRLVGWDCTLQTAISDVEVEYMNVTGPIQLEINGKKYPFGNLWNFGYPVIPDSLIQKDDQEIAQFYDENITELKKDVLIFGTTRPETMIGDSALAVHPEDERYTLYHNKFVYHPIRRCKIPIVTDNILVDINFGTGVVKITPAHDPNDFETGKRHNLEFINMLQTNGNCYAPNTEFHDVPRLDARIQIIQFFTKLELYQGKTPNPMAIGLSQRSRDVVEPMLKPQWYLNCESMAKQSLLAVEQGDLIITPKQHEQTWKNYLENIRPWCISRQLWWGHQIPLYKVWIEGQSAPDGSTIDHWVFGRNEEEARKNGIQKLKSQNIQVERDQDVTDTWFSSSLFPFSAFNWPDSNEDFNKYFPSTVLETGHDILFFWVARMVMTSLHLHKKLPFKEVYLHAMVRDSKGEKMSKSKGNVIDPLDCIFGISLKDLHARLREGNLSENEIKLAEKLQKAEFPAGIAQCGTDALRMALCLYTGAGRSVNLDLNKIISQRNFCNKIFNSVKYAIQFCNINDDTIGEFTSIEKFFEYSYQNKASLRIETKDILRKLSQAIYKYNKSYRQNLLNEASEAVLIFWWDEFCDKFLETVKPLNNDLFTKQTLLAIIDTCLRLIHPFMPFLAEEMYQHLPHFKAENFDSIMVATMPKDCHWFNFGDYQEFIQYDEKCVNIDSIYTKIRTDQVFAIGSEQFDVAMHCTKVIRSIRAQYKLTNQKVKVFVNYQLNKEQLNIITILGQLESIEVIEKEEKMQYCACGIVSADISLFVFLKGLVDFQRESELKQKELMNINEQIIKTQVLMEGDNYCKMPQKLKDGYQVKLADYLSKRNTLEDVIQQYQQMAE